MLVNSIHMICIMSARMETLDSRWESEEWSEWLY